MKIWCAATPPVTRLPRRPAHARPPVHPRVCTGALPALRKAELEEEEAHLADELAASFVPYADAELEHEAVTSWKLSRVPDALTKELETYLVNALRTPAPPRLCALSTHALSTSQAYRTSPLNRARDGTCCVDVTVGNDR